MRRLLKNRVAGNAAWMIGCKVAQAVLGLVISMLTARYLGPGNYGLINYAASLTLFAGPVAQLGLTSTLVFEAVDNPGCEETVFGSAIAVSAVSSLLCMIGITLFARIAAPGETATICVCGIYSILLLTQAAELIQYWFQAKLLSKYVAAVTLAAYALMSGYQVVLLLTGMSVEWYAAAKTLEHGMIAAALLIVQRWLSGRRLRISFRMMKKLVLNSRYYMLSGLLVLAFGQADRIMIRWMIDDAAMGFYSAAVVCANLTDFVFMAIIDSFRPAILEAHNRDRTAYEEGISGLYSIVIWAALLQSVLITALAGPMVRILYGESYMPAVGALRILVWYTAFSYIGSARLIWIQAEALQRLLWKINLCGALCNIGLNAILIPGWGIEGAAVASLATQMFVNVGIGFILPSLRDHNKLLLRGADIRCVSSVIKKWI